MTQTRRNFLNHSLIAGLSVGVGASASAPAWAGNETLHRTKPHTNIGTLGQNASLRAKVIREMASKPVERLAKTGQDKVLWTEKFLALGCYASKAVWLTDVFLTTATTSAAGKFENIQKLTIKGAILPR